LDLIFVNFRLLELGLALLLEGDDDQGHEDVHEEEGKDDEVNNVENGHLYPGKIKGELVMNRGRSLKQFLFLQQYIFEVNNIENGHLYPRKERENRFIHEPQKIFENNYCFGNKIFLK
jgi:hypothetical protein